MKRCISFLLAFLIILGSATGFAAPGDIIHTGLKKSYKAGNNELVNDIIAGADVNKFYKEIEGDKFVNIVEEEKKQLNYLSQLLQKSNITSSEAIKDYITKNQSSIDNEFKSITNTIAKSFDKITDENKGGLEDYFGDSKALTLINPDNYSTPVPGYSDDTIKIVNLSLPKNSSKWVYKIGEKAFIDLDANMVVQGTKPYSSGTDIKVKPGDFLFLGTTDLAGKLKAYASIEIVDDMVKKPRIKVEIDKSINAKLSKGINHSGATKISGLDEGSWNLIVLDKKPETIYEDSKFNSINYLADMEIIMATDAEIDNMNDTFIKYLLIYSEKDGKIDKYNVLEVKEDNISEAMKAVLLPEEDYSTPVKGDSAGTTKIVELNLSNANGASKWMYALVEDSTVPFLDRVYSGSLSYEAGQGIQVTTDSKLMILATDDNDRVRAYNIIEIMGDMIKDPLATKLKETTHYTNPVKGSTEGTTKFGFLKYEGITSWKYALSDKVIDAPELNSTVSGNPIIVTSDVSNDLSIETDLVKLKEDNFKRYMMIYGLNIDGTVQVYKDFDMDDSNVRMPDSQKLETPKHYSDVIKGNSPNTTRIVNLKTTGLPGNNLKFKYKVIDGDVNKIEFNEKILDTKDLLDNVDIPVNVGKHLLLLAVDKSNKTKAYKTIELVFDNVKAGNASDLQSTTNYQGPVPGNTNNSTKFTFLNLPAGASKFVYKIGDTSFGIPEAGSIVKDTFNATMNIDIEKISANKYLFLLAVDSSNKVIAYKEFKLLDSQVKGSVGKELVSSAYDFIKGDKPSTTKLRLEPLGLDDPNNIRWSYKFVDSIPINENEKPYFNQIIDGTTIYTINSITKIGPDIAVTKTGTNYGHILILATDSSGRVKGYKYETILGNHVKEHTPEIKEGLKLKKGTVVDSVNFTDLTGFVDGNKYKYLISNTKLNTPAIGDDLPNDVKDYTKGQDITVHIGKYLNLYELGSDSKITKFSSFQVEEVKQGSATLTQSTLLEGNIVNGGTKLTITLTDANWADVVNDKSIRDKLFNGFKSNSEDSQWSKVVAAMIADGKGAISINSNTITILLPETPGYNITDDQSIDLTIPYEAIRDALNPIVASGNIIIKPTIGATISGDVVSSIVRQDDIKAGTKTIVVELADGTWDINADINKIIDGFSGGSNWNKIAAAVKSNGSISRNSGSKVTITLPKVIDVDFGSTMEIVSLTIPKELINGATENVAASPNFTLYPNMIEVKGEAVADKDNVILTAPDYRIIDTNQDTWIIDVTAGTLKANITDKDLVFTGLPRGLLANVSKVSDKNQIQIKLTGTASVALANDSIVKVKIKGSAVVEPNSVDSHDIGFNLIKGNSLISDLQRIKVNVVDGKLMDDTIQLNSDKIEFSLDSSNGTNGSDWTVATSDNTKNIPFKAGKVYVREASNPKVFHLVTTLSHPKSPVGISISEVKYDSLMNVKVKLNGFETGVEYDISTDGGNTWSETFNTSSEVSLDKVSDLKIRLKATKENLPSLATAKLNGLYLGNVKLHVGSGKITGTNTSMQYSLDSTNGIDGKWITAKTNETLLNLTAGNKVWIRQQNSKVNYRELGDVTQQNIPDLGTEDAPKVIYNIADGSITNNTGQALEYRVNGGTWIKLNTNPTVNVQFVPGVLEIRASGTDSILPSPPKALTTIPNPIDPPELKGDDDKKTISYLDKDGSWKTLDNSFKYKIGSNGDWKFGDTFKDDPSKDDTVVIYVRKNATDKLLPSKEKPISFTANMDFKNIIFDIAGKVIEGTTTNMEYSIGSTDVDNNLWKTAANGKTAIEPFEGMYIWLREKNKPSTETLYIDKLARQVLPDLTSVYYNIGSKKISNQSDYNLEYSINNGNWIRIDAKTDIYDVNFTSGKLEFRQRSTTEKMESHPKLKTTIKAKISGPFVEFDDVTNSINSINASTNDWQLFEYRINPSTESPWISGELLATEDLSGSKKLEIRIKATNSVLSSQITKFEFTKNLELEHITLSTHVNPHELNGTTKQMEYNIYLKDGTNTLWIVCTDGNTTMPDWLGQNIKNGKVKEIKVRDSKQPENMVIIYP